MAVPNKTIDVIDFPSDTDHWFLADGPYVALSLPPGGRTASKGDVRAIFGPRNNIEIPIPRNGKPKSKDHGRSFLASQRAIHDRRRRARLGKPGKKPNRPLDQLAISRSSQRCDAAWERHFEELKAFRERHGHCNVSTQSKTDAALGRWIHVQRQQRMLGKLNEEQIARLDALGFAWRSPMHAARWELQFNELKRFQKRHGHCNASTLSKTDAALGRWVHAQRQQRKRGNLSSERIGRLDQLGFVWNVIHDQWERMFAVLVEYQRVQGHCRVPAKNSKLGWWVSLQRSYYRKGKLDEVQIRRLEALGFHWKIREDQ